MNKEEIIAQIKRDIKFYEKPEQIQPTTIDEHFKVIHNKICLETLKQLLEDIT